ncbi:orotidine-5'-phosphate decarboxylase [candidate division WOR-3 bacterium]|nr:orotidine-5'-phosphate decarboxylase [candidate division WOR-3 bacterium]
MDIEPKERLIVALDVGNLDSLKNIIDRLGDNIVYYKIGLELFTALGPTVIQYLKSLGKKVFLDLKLHDIPNTVARAVKAASNFGVDMMTIHTLGGFEMMESAQKASWRVGEGGPKIIGITLLTSLDEAFINDFLEIKRKLKDEVLKLASLALSAGLSGVVSSPQEVKEIKECCGNDFIVVSPGIRPEGYDTMDHARSATPKEAIKMGADYIVVGRPILNSENPLWSAKKILEDIEDGLSSPA